MDIISDTKSGVPLPMADGLLTTQQSTRKRAQKAVQKSDNALQTALKTKETTATVAAVSLKMVNGKRVFTSPALQTAEKTIEEIQKQRDAMSKAKRFIKRQS